MNKLLVFLLVLLSSAVFAQERQLLKGKVITNIGKVEGVAVTNTAAQRSTVTDSEGNFIIDARVNDTLRFTGEVFKPLKIVLKAKDFAERLFVVKTEPIATMLDEVIVTGLTGDLAVDSKKIKTMQINTWFNPLEINKHVLVRGEANWITGFANIFKKQKKQKRATEYKMADVPEQKLFSEVVKEAYADNFFTETLAIPARFIGAFLSFCDEDAKQYLLMAQNEQELIDFLKAQSVKFLKLNPDAR